MHDEHNLHNVRLKSITDRAIEYHEGDTVNLHQAKSADSTLGAAALFDLLT